MILLSLFLFACVNQEVTILNSSLRHFPNILEPSTYQATSAHCLQGCYTHTRLTVQISLTSDLVMYPFLSTSNREKAHSSFLVVFPVDVMWRAMMYSLKSSVPSSFVSKERKTCISFWEELAVDRLELFFRDAPRWTLPLEVFIPLGNLSL